MTGKIDVSYEGRGMNMAEQATAYTEGRAQLKAYLDSHAVTMQYGVLSPEQADGLFANFGGIMDINQRHIIKAAVDRYRDTSVLSGMGDPGGITFNAASSGEEELLGPMTSDTAARLIVQARERYMELPAYMRKAMEQAQQALMGSLTEDLNRALVMESAARAKEEEERLRAAGEKGTPEDEAAEGMEGYSLRVPPMRKENREGLGRKIWEKWLEFFPRTAGEHEWELLNRSRRSCYMAMVDICWRAGYAAGLRRGIQQAEDRYKSPTSRTPVDHIYKQDYSG